MYGEGGEAPDQVAQSSCRCLVVGSVQSQTGWGFEQPALVTDVPTDGAGHGLDLSSSLPT